jgi:hypothetical protein
MPQTVSNKYPKGTGTLTIESDIFSSRPEAAMWIARLVSLWSSNEHLLGAVFCEALGEAKRPAAAMYQALSSSSVQIETATAAIMTQLPSDDVKLQFAGTVAFMKKTKKIRDRLAHWVYACYSDERDTLVLVAPRHVIDHFHLPVEIGKATNLNEHAYLYPASELSNVHDQFMVVERSLQAFLEFGRSRDFATLNRLSEMPQIQAEIDRIAAGKKPHEPRLGRPGEERPQ